jgi:hypothetical protein
MDCFDIKPGQNWEFEIEKAINKAKIILAFISNNSIEKRGFVQRELKRALYNSQSRLRSDIYIIPILLDEALRLPEDLSHIHYISATSPTRIEQIARAVFDQLEALGEDISRSQEKSSIRWSMSLTTEAWDGLPGYTAQMIIPEFTSIEFPLVSQITDIIRGHYFEVLSSMRSLKFSQDHQSYNFGQPRSARENAFDLSLSEVIICGKMISIVFSAYSYSGGAHGHGGPNIFNFMIDPLIQIKDFSDLFADREDCLSKIRDEVRRILSGDAFGDNEITENSVISPNPDRSWIHRGTETWTDMSMFSVHEKGIILYFPAYQCDCFAIGTLSVLLSYTFLAPFLKPHFMNACRGW